MKKRVVLWGMGLVFALFLLSVLAMWFENRLIFFPEKYPRGGWDGVYEAAKQGRLDVAVEDCWFTTEDDAKIHAWYISSKPPRAAPPPAPGAPSPKPVVLWFHGNAGNIAGWFPDYRSVARRGVDVLAVDYRGYGRSEGSPDEEGVYADALAAWVYLVDERGIEPSRIVIYGFSLGGAVAVDLASKVEAAGLVVQSSFTSVPDMAASIFPLVPKALVRTQMDSAGKIAGILAPKLFIHSPRDELVPYRLGKRLYEAAADPKSFYVVERAGHNDTFAAGGQPMLTTLLEFIEAAVAK